MLTGVATVGVARLAGIGEVGSDGSPDASSTVGGGEGGVRVAADLISGKGVGVEEAVTAGMAVAGESAGTVTVPGPPQPARANPAAANSTGNV